MTKSGLMSLMGFVAPQASVALSATAVVAAAAYFFWLTPSDGPAAR